MRQSFSRQRTPALPRQAIYWRWFAKVKPEDLYSHTPLPDMGTCAHLYPRVVVQLPMYNEREVRCCIA